MEKKDYKINDELVGERLDKAISIKDNNLSRAQVQRLIDENNILVNGKNAKASYKVNAGDIITINYEEFSNK